jgi:hypothetical protein
MRDIQRAGIYADIVDAPSPSDPENTVKLGVSSTTIRRYRDRGLVTAIAQYYGLVQEGLLLARHSFRGLERPLALREDMDADQTVVVYTWRSTVDYEWHGTQYDGHPMEKTPLPGRVFVVLVREDPGGEEGVHGSIERWNWVNEDLNIMHAPIGYERRYRKRLWSRNI